MLKAISNTSPLLYLYRIGGIEWLPQLFDEVWTPEAVQQELDVGRAQGYDVPNLTDYAWLTLVNPTATPSEWLALDLGAGELAALAVALEHPQRVILLDDLLARRTAQVAGLPVWGTLKVVLEAKAHGLIATVNPSLIALRESGMWLSAEVIHRILVLADES